MIYWLLISFLLFCYYFIAANAQCIIPELFVKVTTFLKKCSLKTYKISPTVYCYYIQTYRLVIPFKCSWAIKKETSAEKHLAIWNRRQSFILNLPSRWLSVWDINIFDILNSITCSSSKAYGRYISLLPYS